MLFFINCRGDGGSLDGGLASVAVAGSEVATTASTATASPAPSPVPAARRPLSDQGKFFLYY